MELLMTILVLVAIGWIVECRTEFSALLCRRFERYLERRRNGAALNVSKPFDGAYTLVVVDMQPDFQASCDPSTLRAVEVEIQAAVARAFPVVVLEYACFGHTHDVLMQQLKDSRHCVKTKYSDDGSKEVTETCRTLGWNMRHFRVCGVNANACVQATVEGLVETVPETTVEVVREACNAHCGQEKMWDGYRRLSSRAVRIVSQCGAQAVPCVA